MKKNKELLIHENGEEVLLVPTGELSKRFQGIIRGNATTGFLMKLLEKGSSKEEMIEALIKNYDVSYEQAREDIEQLIQILNKGGFLQ